MALKDDTVLEELDTKLTYHCKDKNYSLVVSIMAEDMAEGQVVSCNGDLPQFAINITAFARAIESKTNYPFRKYLMEVLQADLNISDKNIH